MRLRRLRWFASSSRAERGAREDPVPNASREYGLVDHGYEDLAVGPFRAIGLIEPQLGFSFVGVRTVTGETAIRKNGLDVKIEIDLVGRIRLGRQDSRAD